ncbi:hypothetical protein RclHR1_03890003 [Rhizophagus clarus]|uniref:Uncharacterized protein n=1 Tax=Rhizophagus clarus TaxID=94130 RepID=A0A2Z6RD96_9GLOM|nr:hypothetical protein RclHR1_03890003 [Rhizophagus clarus]
MNATNLRFHFKDRLDNQYELRDSQKHPDKLKESGIWVYYLPPQDKTTQQYFEQIMNNVSTNLDIIHIWMSDINHYFNHALDINPLTSSKKEDIPLCFIHFNLIDFFRFLNPKLKEFSWHKRTNNTSNSIDICIDHIWIQRNILQNLRPA